ncbi:FecR domain-containing protein [Desulfurobacterium atlanticum]|uniref:FecR family protein n=1 Tax=Desulfurobacterium atlanticum TaxID=240169 RepID=A0A238YX24_9BACT|nr:FecR domain-containing protein [Desulfurobacterium atlanticum]SNR75620.1 FecR family protein [Desulfurobacterium atlanticum]
MIRKIFLVLLLFTLPAGAVTAGRITDFEGKVKIFEDTFLGKKVTNVPFKFGFNSKIKTYSSSRAFIDFGFSKLLLLEKSVLTVKNRGDVYQEEGEVIYSVKRYGNVKGFFVKTPVSIIGVKGTEFIIAVGSVDSVKVGLKKGFLSIRSVEEPFKVYKAVVEDEFSKFKKEFENYKKKQVDEFEAYKRKLKEEFLFYAKEFTISAGKSLVIKGNKVVIQDTIPLKMKEKFKLFEKFFRRGE